MTTYNIFNCNREETKKAKQPCERVPTPQSDELLSHTLTRLSTRTLLFLLS